MKHGDSPNSSAPTMTRKARCGPMAMAELHSTGSLKSLYTLHQTAPVLGQALGRTNENGMLLDALTTTPLQDLNCGRKATVSSLNISLRLDPSRDTAQPVANEVQQPASKKVIF